MLEGLQVCQVQVRLTKRRLKPMNGQTALNDLSFVQAAGFHM